MVAAKTVDDLDAEIKALLAQRDEALKASKDADLETVKRLCKQHGFTATQLRGCLKTRAKNKKDDDSAGTAADTAAAAKSSKNSGKKSTAASKA
jgi:transposase-like protein